MCDNSQNVSTSTSSQTLPGGLTDAINSASAGALAAYRAGNPGTSVGPAPVAPLNGWQNGAASTTAGLASWTPQQVGTNYTPQQVSTNYTPQAVTPGSVTQFGSPTVSGAQIASYQNPYTASVIGTSLDELNRQLERTNQTASGQAASAGAFGGDRAAIVQTENARNANQIAAQTIAGLNSQGYSQAAALAEQDATRALTAGTSQAQLDANVGQGNQYADIQAANLNSTNQRANQATGLAAANLNSTNERANQAAGLSGAQLNLTAAGQEANLGAQFRQVTQDNLTSNYNAAYSNAFWPVSSVSTLAGQLGSLSGAAPRTTSTTSTTPGPSTVGQIAGLGTAALGLNSLIPGGLAGGVKSLFGGSGSSAADAASTSPFNGAGVDSSSIPDFGSFGDAGSFDNYDFSFARGGLAGYADGGYVGSGGPWDFSSWSRRQANKGLAPMPPPGPTYADQMATASVNPMAPDGPDAPMPTGPNATANLGLAAAVPSSAPVSAVDQALAINPADIVNGVPPEQAEQADNSIPLDQMPVPAEGGLAAAAPSQQAQMQGDLPTPPVPPAQGGLAAAVPAAATAPSRMDMSANPSSPIPGGFATPGTDPSHNKLGMSLLAAGLGMMASKSHSALGSIGEGGLAGVQQFDTMTREQNAADARRAQMAQTAAYQQGLLKVRQDGLPIAAQKAATGQQRVEQQGAHYDAQDAAAAARTDAYVQGKMAQAAKAGSPTSATMQQAAMDAFMQANPGATAADAWSYLKGFAGRDANAAARLGLAQQKVDQQAQQNSTTNDLRERNQQRLTNNNEDASARQMQFNNPKLSYAQALATVRGGREQAGPAPMATTPTAAAPTAADPLASARAAIARGAPRDAVVARLRASGMDPSGL